LETLGPTSVSTQAQIGKRLIDWPLRIYILISRHVCRSPTIQCDFQVRTVAISNMTLFFVQYLCCRKLDK